MSKIYFTVNGEEITEEEIEDGDYVLCGCGWAIHEDEYIPCPECGSSMCLYDWQDNGWGCPHCGNRRFG
ncbi:MAG: hypothetical protein PHZ19_12235 [Candidatus Thermoplasmatota archaeon]|nr:hypothetical protein [Candidatus Thermoplasmatota archaeon]